MNINYWENTYQRKKVFVKNIRTDKRVLHCTCLKIA